MSLKQQGCTLRTECEQMVSHVYSVTSVGSVHLDVVPCCNETSDRMESFSMQTENR